MYGTDGNGYSPCNFHKIVVFNQSIKSGNFLVKPEDLNVSPTFDDPLTISSCLSFEDLDSDNIYELIAPDNILAYAFSDFDLSGFGSFYKIKRITSKGIYDITNQHKNFMVKVAEKNWNEILQKVSSTQKDNSQQSSEVIIPYFGNMVAYITAKSILGEYKEAMSLVTKRIEIDDLNFTLKGQKFPYEVEEFLIERGYIKKSDGLMVYLPQNNKLTCQQSIDSVKAELIKRKYFVDYKDANYGLIKPKLVINNDRIKQEYYEYPKNRTKTIVFQLSGNFDAVSDFLRSRKLMESLTARILGSCQDFGLVEYVHWYEGYVPVGYFPDNSVRTFTWMIDIDDSEYSRSDNGYTKYQWGYYFSP